MYSEVTWEVAFRADRAPRVEGERMAEVISSSLVAAAWDGDWMGMGVGGFALGFGFRAVCKLGSAPYWRRTSTNLCRPCLAAI